MTNSRLVNTIVYFTEIADYAIKNFTPVDASPIIIGEKYFFCVRVLFFLSRLPMVLFIDSRVLIRLRGFERRPPFVLANWLHLRSFFFSLVRKQFKCNLRSRGLRDLFYRKQ